MEALTAGAVPLQQLVGLAGRGEAVGRHESARLGPLEGDGNAGESQHRLRLPFPEPATCLVMDPDSHVASSVP